MQLYELHAMLYDSLQLPEGTVINVCETTGDDARLVDGDLVAVATALGLSEEQIAAAAEGDHWDIDRALTQKFQALIAEFGVEQP